MDDVRGTALVLSMGYFGRTTAKTAHGLIRGGDRFEIVGLVDPTRPTPTAEWPRLPPVFADAAEALACLPQKPRYAVLGAAIKGGRLPPAARGDVALLLEAGVEIVSGLHQTLSDDPEFAAAAARGASRVHEVRRPKPWSELQTWTGEIGQVKAPIVAMLGMDCAIGKRTTARLAAEGCRARGLNAQVIYTGQTGWMQGGRYGFIMDATLLDFVTGELERAVVDCERAETPDLILIEGQASLRNPMGPYGAELLVTARAKATVLQIAPMRRYYHVDDALRWPIPEIASEIELIGLYGSEVLALTMNEETLSDAEAEEVRGRIERDLGLPVIRPLSSVERLVDILAGHRARHRR